MFRPFSTKNYQSLARTSHGRGQLSAAGPALDQNGGLYGFEGEEIDDDD